MQRRSDARELALMLALLAMSFTYVGAAGAARPFVTDDARVVDPGGYQIETFVKRQNRFGEHEFWLLPAMNAGGAVELTLGGTSTDSALNGNSHSTFLQAKTLLNPLETNGSGYAFTLGVARLQPPQAPRTDNPYLNGIGSFSLRDDHVVLHANLGALRDRQAGLTRGTWGLGGEFVLTPRVIAIAESYGQRGEKPTLHGGIRFWLVPNRVQLDGTLGSQNSGPPKRNFHSVGLRILF